MRVTQKHVKRRCKMTKARPYRALIDAVVESSTLQSKNTARTDANVALEALLAKCGVEETLEAISKHGLKGESYRYIVDRLYDEARRRVGRK